MDKTEGFVPKSFLGCNTEKMVLTYVNFTSMCLGVVKKSNNLSKCFE